MAGEDTNTDEGADESIETGGEASGSDGAASESPKSLGDAISEALEPTLPRTEEGGGDEGAGDEGADEEGGEDEDSGEEAADEGDQERNPDGTFKAVDKSKTGEGAGKAGDGKTGADGKPLVDKNAAKTDVVNDPIPEDVKGRTRERMQGLIDTVKQKDEIIQNQDTVMAAVRGTGASPEEFAAMISYMGWVHSEDPKQLTQARNMLMAELEGVCLKLGEPAPGIDFIGKYPDLKAKLDAGQIDAETAQEIAITRTKQKAQQDAEARRTTNTEATRQRATQERNSAIADLDQLGATLSENDPDFDEKMKLMPDLKTLGEKNPPSKWRSAFTAAYKAAGTLLANRRAKAQGSGGSGQQQRTNNGGQPQNKGQPLRGNQSPSGSTGSNRQPKNLFDAISQAVDEADGR